MDGIISAFLTGLLSKLVLGISMKKDSELPWAIRIIRWTAVVLLVSYTAYKNYVWWFPILKGGIGNDF